jgi:Rrf2 family protein
MQLTRAADYGVRVMVHLAGQPLPKRVALADLAEATGTPESFLSKVLQALTRAGLLVSQRGQAGGFELASRGRESSVRDVVEAVDGPIHLNLCLTSGKLCARQAWCPAHPVWGEAQRAMLEVLERARIADLAHGCRSNGVRPRTGFAALESIAAAGVDEPGGCACHKTTGVA